MHRIYDAPSDRDGTRVLVDRIWPRGIRKADAGLHGWCQEVAPSTPLRKWYGHDPTRFEEFNQRYLAELTAPERVEALRYLGELADTNRLTLLTGAKQVGTSHAVVLAELLCRQHL